MNVLLKKFSITIVFVWLLTTGGCVRNHQPENERVYLSGICSGFSKSFFEIAFNTYQKNNKVIINGVASNPEMSIRSLRGKIIDFASVDELPDEAFFPGFGKNIIALPVCKDKTDRLSWILVYKNQAYNGRSFEKYTQLKYFLKYIYSTENQKIITVLGYEKLPDEVIRETLHKIDLMEWKDER
jgi:ABC-type phosphate transport system substrate-binding protein